MILVMTRPITTPKVLLVEDPRTARGSRVDTPIRRYRLARLRFDSPPTDGPSRFEYLKRVYD
jgi:hypothetical protein